MKELLDGIKLERIINTYLRGLRIDDDGDYYYDDELVISKHEKGNTILVYMSDIEVHTNVIYNSFIHNIIVNFVGKSLDYILYTYRNMWIEISIEEYESISRKN